MIMRPLQAAVDSLRIGRSDLYEIMRVFGSPQSLRNGPDWHEGETLKRRTMRIAEYPSIGLSFAFFTSPSELFSITLTTKEVCVRGLRIGDSLDAVQRELGEEGTWSTTAVEHLSWLDFEGLGLKFGFEEEGSEKKFPVELARPETVSMIKIYNSSLHFCTAYRPLRGWHYLQT